MTKIIVMSDQHLGKFWKGNNSSFNKGRKLIDSFIFNLNNCIKEEDKKDSILFFCGDLYDSINTNVEMLVYIKKYLIKELKKFKGIYIIAGNHETFIDKNGLQDSLLSVSFADTDKINLFINGVYNEVIDDYNFIFIPFQKNLKRILEEDILEHLKGNKKNIIVSHFTSKEIFSFEELELSKYIDKYYEIVGKNNLPYILLGHYHFPVEFTYKETSFISIGNSYYLTISDLKSDLKKRFLEFDLDSNSVESKKYNLPNVFTYIIDSQNNFEIDLTKRIHDEVNKEDIIFIKSNHIIDYSSLLFEGYDVSFELLEDNIDDGLVSLKESLSSDVIEENNNGKTLIDRWNKFIDLVPSSILNDNEKDAASWLFENRSNINLNSSNLLEMI